MDYNNALNFLINVVIYGAAWFAGWMAIMAVNARWRKEKRQYDKDKVQHDRIIVKKNEEAKVLTDIEKKITDKQTILQELEAKEKALLNQILEVIKPTTDNDVSDNDSKVEPEVHSEEANEPVEPEKQESIDELTTVELRALAKDRGLKGFSRMSKAELIHKLAQ